MKRIITLLLAAPIAFFGSIGLAAPARLAAADEAAAFKAAGFILKSRQWRSECGLNDTDSASYMPGTIEDARDLNGDGRLEAVITEGGSFCYGNAGTGFAIVSDRGGGVWKLIYSGQGIPEFLAARGVGGWPDIAVGGPGFCFPVLRWNGKEYRQHRFEYEGKSCRP